MNPSYPLSYPLGRGNKLTELAVRNARGRTKPYSLSDGLGLHLQVNPNGSKWWRYRFRFGRKAVCYLLDTYLLLELGSMPMDSITVPELFRVLKRIEDKGLFETRKKASQLCGKMWRYAVVTGRAQRDITIDLRGAYLNPKPQHHPAITEPRRIGQLLRAIDGYTGHRLTVIALKLAPPLFTRTVELRLAKWDEFDRVRGMWRIPAERIKQREPHYVPLSRQALELLTEAYRLTGHCEYVLANPSRRSRPMSNNTLNSALHALGFKDEMTGHGFRTLASTRLNAMAFQAM